MNNRFRLNTVALRVMVRLTMVLAILMIVIAPELFLLTSLWAAADRTNSVLISQVPLREGLTLVTASQQDDGDYEMLKTVTKVDAKAITVTVLSEEPTICGEEMFGRYGKRPSTSRRVILREDMERAHKIRFGFKACLSEPEYDPGVTAISVSASVLRELRTEGRTNLTIIGDSGRIVAGVLTRIEPQSLPFKVILNDEPVEVATIHTRWHSGKYDIEYWILDDATNPLVLRNKHSNGKVGLDVVKLSFPTGERTARLERDLSEQGRTVVYGIYFDFASDHIKEESEPVLKEIADVMTKNPMWRLAVEGHTDNLGGTEANLQLSKRRAAAVRTVLGERYRISPTRLEPAGFGEARPKATNETLEGRALNRRVELVRIGR